MKSDELKYRLNKAIEDGIIKKCKGFHNLRCPAAGYPLVHGRCRNEQNCNVNDTYECANGDARICRHRLDISYNDGSPVNTIYVRYRTHPGVREGFIDSKDEQLLEVLNKIDPKIF